MPRSGARRGAAEGVRPVFGYGIIGTLVVIILIIVILKLLGVF
jgi:hypothetical protein